MRTEDAEGSLAGLCFESHRVKPRGGLGWAWLPPQALGRTHSRLGQAVARVRFCAAVGLTSLPCPLSGGLLCSPRPLPLHPQVTMAGGLLLLLGIPLSLPKAGGQSAFKGSRV